MANLDTSHGLKIPTMAQIIQSFVTQINRNIDPSFAITNSNILSQIIVILAQELSNLFDTLQVCFDVLDPSTARGQNLLDACQYVGIYPSPALPTQVYVLLTTSTNLTVPIHTQLSSGSYTIQNQQAYSISPNNCAQAVMEVLSAQYNQHYTFELDDILIDYVATPSDTIATIAQALQALVLSQAPLFSAVINASNNAQIIINKTTNGDIDYSQSFVIIINTLTYLSLANFSLYAAFMNTVTGNISIPANTFDLSTTPIQGLTTTQPENGINGREADSDQSLRLRRDLSLSYGGNRSIDAIRAALINTPYVQKSVVYQNQDDSQLVLDSSITLLPHSIYAIVLGGYQVDIAKSIFNRMSEGIQTNGSIAVALNDYQNNIVINFDYATQISIAIQINVTLDQSLLYKINKNVIETITKSIFSYIQSLNIGETMYMLSLEGAVSHCVQSGIKALSLAYTILPGDESQSTDLVPLVNQVVVVTEDAINVVVSAS